VIGGGNSGVEAAIDLAGIVAHVTLIEFDSQLRADAVLQDKLRSLPNVTIVTSALTTEVLGDGDQSDGPALQGPHHRALHTVELEGIFVQIGLVPNTEWLKGSVARIAARRDRESMRAGPPAYPACLQRATAPRCRTSRSSSPWAKAPKAGSRPLIT
jgi:alkyl hydroperoxide reductase subunit F